MKRFQVVVQRTVEKTRERVQDNKVKTGNKTHDKTNQLTQPRQSQQTCQSQIRRLKQTGQIRNKQEGG